MITSMLNLVQAKLKALYGPAHYYSTKYAAEELSYSGLVPFWMGDVLKPGHRVLDIGPGYGTLASLATLLTGRATVTMDRVPFITHLICVEMCLRRMTGDIERQACPVVTGESVGWDAVIMTEVLEHFNFHPTPTLKKVRATMAEGGQLFLSTPDARSWGRCNHYKHLYEIPAFDASVDDFDSPKWIDSHIWQYNLEELLGILAGSGFRIIDQAKSESAGGQHFNIRAEAC